MMPKRNRNDDYKNYSDKRHRTDESDRRNWHDNRSHHERSYSMPGNIGPRWSGPQPPTLPPLSSFGSRAPWQNPPRQGPPSNYVSGSSQYWEWQSGQNDLATTSAAQSSSRVTDDGEDLTEISDDDFIVDDDVKEEKAVDESVTTPSAVQGYSQQQRKSHKSYYRQSGETHVDENEGKDDEEEDHTQAYSQVQCHVGRFIRGKFPSKFHLESASRDIINKLANDTQILVSAHAIEKALIKNFEVNDVRDLGIKFIDDINFIHDHLKLQGRVSSFIQAYCSMATISSYYDLKECLQEFTPESGNFLDLNLGPLSKQPLVYKYFKIPTNYKLPKITGAQVWMHLKDFMTEHDLWKGQVDLNEFIKHLQSEYRVPSPLHLGIRIQSLPLAIQMLKKAQKDQGRNLRTAFMQYKMDLANDVSRAFQNFKAEILEKTDKGWEVKKFYCQASVPQVTGSIFNKLQILFNAVLYQNDGKWKELKKVSDIVAAFSSCLAEDRLLAALFQVAVSVSSHDFQEDLVKKIFPHMSDGGGKSKNGDDETTSGKRVKKPNPGELISQMDKYVQRCLNHGQLTLEQMAKIEQKITENHEAKHFGELGYGNFLHYVSETKEVEELLEELGVTLNGGVGGAGSGRTAFHPSLNDVIDLVQQCKSNSTVKADDVENALCSHYNVESVRCLGYGSIKSVFTAHERHQKKQHGDQHAVFYESALCTNSALVRNGSSEDQVGRLGHQSREMGLSCLQSCPLLENLEQWSQWPLVFLPELGPLKQFVQKHGGCHSVQLQGVGTYQTDLVVLETEPGTLLKLATQTSIDHYVTALDSGDVTEICGHLISVIAQSQGLRNAPVSLLASHTLQHMMSIHNKELGSGKGDRLNDGHAVIAFVRECLITLPLKLCHLLADKILLEPLSQVLGGTRSKTLLLESCRSAVCRNRVHTLGILLGVSEWRDHYQQQLKHSHACIVRKIREEKKLLEALVPTDMTEEGSSSSEEEDDDDVASETSKMEVNFLDSDEDEISELKQSPVSSALPSSRTSDGSATSCRDVVELIRREEFGIGMVLNDDARKLLTIQQERIGRSLDRLSKDLYSKDTHFVLELIQNADDNSYPENLVDGKSKSGPTLQFVVNDNCISVLNNEAGFVEKNIRAICDVGKSTKGKHSGGYIGQKGIGFKSVFRISDRPEIHSNGYHIYFDVKSGPMGYILPHWTDDVKSEKDWMTKIILPLKRTTEENDAQQVRSLANRFYDIHPSLLLFLRRLRQIVIVHENDKEVLRMSRRDVGKNVIEIRHNNGTDKWLVIKKQLDATKISLQAKSGVDIASTDVALAFPILPTEQAVPPLPPKQPLFAFLPLRSYGFRFVVQGDFDVPSSREDVDSDSTWNQWLRSEIPNVFVDALDVFTNHPSLDLLEGVLNYLQFVPMEDELLDFFKPVSLHILSRLRTKPCLPVVSAEGDALSWRLPSQIIVTQDHHVLELISAKVLEEHLGLYYLHPKVAKNAQFPLLKSLGVRTLNTQHLLEVGRSLIRMWTDREEKAELPADVITSLARWFVCLARSLDDFANHKDDVRYIQTLELIPLADCSMTSLERSTVFFPPEESDDEILTMRLLLGDFCMLDYRLISSLDHVTNLTVRQLLSQLGVHDASPHSIIHCHVMPVLKTDQWKEKDRHILEAYVHHIRHLYTTEPDRLDMNDVASCIRLWTNQGALNPLSSPIHFSVYYKNPVDLCQVFPGQPWFLVDKCYLRRKMNPENIELWRQFLQAIGVTDFLIVREVTETKTVEELENSPFAGDVEDLTNCTGPFIMKDYVSLEFRALVESSDYDHVTEMAKLAELMDKFFHQYEHAMNASLCDSDGKLCRSADSSFRTLLRSAKWLPGKTVRYSIVGGSLTCERDVKLYSASELFLPQNTLRHCLSDHVPYLQTKLLEKTPFLKELGITHALDVDLMVQFLLKWSERKFFAEPAEFITSVEHMRTVYAFLHDNMPRNTIRTIFKQHPVVFVPRKSPVQEDLVSAGDFHRLCDVIWSDPTGIFFKYSGKLKHEQIVTLNEFYPGLERFFVDLLNLNKHPTLMNYVEALTVVAEPFLAHGSNVRDCFTLMELFGQRLRSMEEQERAETVAELKRKFKGVRFIPMKRVAFACLEDRPMIPDTTVLDLFNNPDQEDLINVVAIDTVDENDGPRRKEKFTETNSKYNEEELLYFLELLGVERASVCMEQTYTHNNAVCSQHLQIYFHKIIPAVQYQKMRKLTWAHIREFRNVFTLQLFLYNDHKQCYQQLNDDGVADKFAQMQFYQVAELHSVFTITHTNLRHQRKEKVLIYDDENALYIHKQHMDAFSDLHKELARCLSYGNAKVGSSIREFVTDLLPMVQGENVVDMELLCQQRSWQPLPPGEIQWVVQMPELEKEEEEEEEVEAPEREVDVDIDMAPDNGILDQDEPLDHVVRMEDEEKSCEVVGSVAWPPVPSRKENTEGKKTANKVFTEEEGHKDIRNAVPLFRGQNQQMKSNSQSTPALPPLPVSSGWREKSSKNAYQTAPRPVMPFDDTKPDKNVNLWGPRPVWWASEWPPSVDYIGPAPVGWIGPWPPRKEPWGEKPCNYNGLWPPPAYAVGTPPTDWKDAWPPQATIWGDKPSDWKGKWPPPHEYIGPAPSTWLGPWPPSSAWMTGHAEIWQRYGGQQEAQESKVEVPDQTQASSYWLDKPTAKSEDDHWEEVPADEVDQLDHEHYRYERYDGKLWRKQIPYGVSGDSTLTGVTFGPWEIFDGKDFDEYYYEYACVDGYNYRRKIIRPKRKWTDRQNRGEEGNGDDDFGPWEAFNGTEKDEAQYEYYEEGGYCYRRRRKQAIIMPSGEKRGFWEPCDSTMVYDEQIFEYCRDAEGKQFRRRLVAEGGGPRWQLCTQSADINDSRFVYHMEAGKLYRCEANLASRSGNSAATPTSSDGTTVLKPKGVRQFTAKASPGDLDLANVMDDIALGREILLPRKVLLDSAQGMTNLGRYGENLVFHHLLQNKYVFPGHRTMEIVWVNENDERGEPFDILIRMENEQSRSLVQLFIEVKATMTEDKDLFEITGREVQFAYQKGEYYHLYRVYNANDPDKVRIARIKNLALKIDQKMVKLCMVI